ncbi:unnamed protein product [Meloidogyne enterolobii]|uniref:Uncharacterized protein n=1 Tax=Meloidogyne enterolobii TaxID=390850 RepID=A0ACB0Z059_MELEN
MSFNLRKSRQGRIPPSFFCTITKGVTHGVSDSIIIPHDNNLSICFLSSSLYLYGIFRGGEVIGSSVVVTILWSPPVNDPRSY